jgi:TolA-binding protein
MKSIERHKLKENEFARSVAQARETLEQRKRDITIMTAVVVVLLIAVAGFVTWRQSRAAAANDKLAQALAIYDAPVVPIPKPAPGSPPPVQQPGTYPTEEAKFEASLPLFIETANQFPSAQAGITARYTAASILARSGKYAEAEQQYQQVIDKAGNSIYAKTARLGLADVQAAQGKYDNAITIYTELSRDPNSQLPVDSVLMQLGRTYARAGRNEEAAGAYNRIISEFPQSIYGADARRELETVKKAA